MSDHLIMPMNRRGMIYHAPTIIILLMGWLFIIHAGTANKRFHPDEALYTTFARNAFVHGDWLLTSPLDKPPISIYANAISQALFGAVITDKGVYDLPIRVGEFVARIPNIFAGIITVALFIALEKKLFSKHAPIGAIALIASPLFITLSASAFTDSLMLMWVMGAWLCIERKQSFLSGFLLMVGFATKPQAIFLLPLLVMRGLWGKSFRDWLSFVAGMTIPLVLLLLWDGSRGTTSIFALGQYNYPTQALINQPNDWLYRATTWGINLIGGINPILIVLGVVMLFIRAFLVIPISSLQHRQTHLKSSHLTRLLWAYIILYTLFHILVGIPIYDRYLLLIIPFIALLLRRHIGFLAILGIVPVVVFVYFDVILDIGRDGYPLDSEARIITLADEINALPFGAIVYDHWRGWELGYYLGAWSDKRRVYYPDPYIQAQDSLNNPEMWTRYLVAPLHYPYEKWILAMQDVGYIVSGYTLVDIPYRLELIPSEGYSLNPYYRGIRGYIIFALDPPPR